jgi:ribonuclease Z
MTFSVTILGSNSAIPVHGRHPSAQVINIHDQLFLVDCGEGTQMRMNEFKIRRSRIHQIFISHLHGDHYFGLIGLINSYHLLKRQEPLHIYAPAGMQEIIEVQLKNSRTEIAYELLFHTIDASTNKKIFENDIVEVYTIPMNHRIECCGFFFREKKGLRKLLPEKLQQHEIPQAYYNALKQGDDYIKKDGSIIKNDELTLAPQPSHTYACCSDTLFNEQIIPIISGADLLYHETTFMNDSAARAVITFHSTTLQAAEIAKKANVKKLLIGHFSAKYESLQPVLEEAQQVFKETVLAEEGKTFSVENA